MNCILIFIKYVFIQLNAFKIYQVLYRYMFKKNKILLNINYFDFIINKLFIS